MRLGSCFLKADAFRNIRGEGAKKRIHRVLGAAEGPHYKPGKSHIITVLVIGYLGIISVTPSPIIGACIRLDM